MNFKGVLGHEFIGIVEECENTDWIGKRVTAEINFSCNECDWCKKGLGIHCPNRKTMGIFKANGSMAEYCKVPIHCLIEIPQEINDDKAVLLEPLSAAYEILEQLNNNYNGNEKIIVVGDGKLGILCSWILSTIFTNVTLLGHHKDKLELAKWNKIKTTDNMDNLSEADIVIEATGSVSGFESSLILCKPRGTLLLKSTITSEMPLNLTSVVLNEITIIGSRCGQFKDGLNILRKYPDMPLKRLISCEYSIDNAIEAFDKSREKEILKVLLNY